MLFMTTSNGAYVAPTLDNIIIATQDMSMHMGKSDYRPTCASLVSYKCSVILVCMNSSRGKLMLSVQG